jgi:nucleotide-binding universal stress UspA family protein
MSNTHPGVVVVGVDGTSVGRAALTFAMREASWRGSELEVVTTWKWSVNTAGFDVEISEEPAETRERAQRAQDAAITAALETVTDPPLTSRHVIEGEPGPALVRLARAADYLVVGSANKNAVTRALLGSVSHYCVRHATCPVVVVPHGQVVNDDTEQVPHEQVPEPVL